LLTEVEEKGSSMGTTWPTASLFWKPYRMAEGVEARGSA